MFTAVLYAIAKTWKQPKRPSAEQRIKMRYTDTMEYYSALKKNGIMIFAATWVELEGIILSEVRQRKDKYHMTSFTCDILKEMIQMNLLTKQKQTHREQAYGCQKEG